MAEDTLKQLRSLNSLLTLVTGSDRELAKQIESAIEFSRGEIGEAHPNHDLLAKSAKRLMELHLSHRTACGFQHCDLRGQGNDPLWIRAQVLAALRKLAGTREAILLVSGLPTVIKPLGGRWSRRRRQNYQDTLSYIQHLAAAHSSPRTRLQLIFI